MQDKKSKKVGTGLSLPIYMRDRIDRERGDISRSRYILRMLEKVEEGQNSKKPQVESRRQPYTQPRAVFSSITGEPEID